LPWLSLAYGAFSAFTMHRGPERAKWVAAAAVLLWLTLTVLHGLGHLESGAEGSRRRRVLGLVHRLSLMATQSAVQLGLFFALPFYFHAATDEPGHVLFMFGLVALCGASLWDPLSAHLLMRPLLAPLLPAVSSFVALDAVLPGLGLSTHDSLRLSALIAALGVAATTAASTPAAARTRATVRALAMALLLPVALELGAAAIVPAAPLRLVKIELGTHVRDHWVVDPVDRLDAAPERLFCASAIESPVGVRDRLFHVWRFDGAVRSRIELSFQGGRFGGYRTYSRIAGFGKRPSGTYSCSVETTSGQVLGSHKLKISSPRG
jgi:hypothetical protein